MDLLDRLCDIARRRNRKIVLPEGDDPRAVAAATRLRDQHLARPTLLGGITALRTIASGLKVSLDEIEVVDPGGDARLQKYAAALANARDSLTPAMATRLVSRPLYFGGMMVRQG
ncbi:MAG: phosphate acyltransferase, partial [Pseudolabrys sp.]